MAAFDEPLEEEADYEAQPDVIPPGPGHGDAVDDADADEPDHDDDAPGPSVASAPPAPARDAIGVPAPANEEELMALMWGEGAQVIEEVKEHKADVAMGDIKDIQPSKKPSTSTKRKQRQQDEDDEEESKRQNILNHIDQELFAAFMHDTADPNPWFGKIVNVKSSGRMRKKTMLEVHWYVANEYTKELEPCWVDSKTGQWTMEEQKQGVAKPYTNLVEWDMMFMWNLKTEADNDRKLLEREARKVQRQWERNTSAKTTVSQGNGRGKRARKQTDSGMFANSQLEIED